MLSSGAPFSISQVTPEALASLLSSVTKGRRKRSASATYYASQLMTADTVMDSTEVSTR